MRKFLIRCAQVLLIIFVIFYLVSSPRQSAEFVRGAWTGISHVLHSAGVFVNNL